MRKFLAVLAVLMLLTGCEILASLPPAEINIVYKGKKFTASKIDGKWSFTAVLTAEEQAEVVKALEQ